MEWLLRRSVGLGLPAPSSLSPVEAPSWDEDDLHAFTDDVDHTAGPLARTVHRHRTRGGGHRPSGTSR